MSSENGEYSGTCCNSGEKNDASDSGKDGSGEENDGGVGDDDSHGCRDSMSVTGTRGQYISSGTRATSISQSKFTPQNASQSELASS